MKKVNWVFKASWVAGLAAVATGCGGGGHGGYSSPAPVQTVVVSGGSAAPQIVVHNGNRGYYVSGSWCDFTNNYCGTGQGYGIVVPAIVIQSGYQGYLLGSNFCSWQNNYCGTGLSWGIVRPVVIVGTGGYYGYYHSTSWCDWTNDYCSTGVSWGISTGGHSYPNTTVIVSNPGPTTTVNGSGDGLGTSPGSVNGSGNGLGTSPGSVNGSGNGFGTSPGSVNGSGSGVVSNGSGNGSSGSVASGGFNSGSFNSSSSSGSMSSGSSSFNSGSFNFSSSGSFNSGSFNSSSSGFNSGSSSSTGNGSGFSVGGATKDVDLQRADLQQQAIEDRAQGIAQQFSMNIESARQLTQLADRMQQLTAAGKGQISDDDRQMMAEAALGVAGVKADEVTAAYAKLAQGDKAAVEGLLGKAAANLGMPSAAGLREQILPALGINLGAAH